MKCTGLLIAAGAVLLLGTQAAVDTAGPVGKVVNLLTDLKAKIDKDSDADEVDFKEHQCWCEKVQASKNELIPEEKRIIAEKEQEISTGKATDKTLENTIVIKKEEITDNEDGQSDATQVRGTQHEASADDTKANVGMINDIGAGVSAVQTLGGSSAQRVADQFSVMGNKVKLDEEKNNQTESKANNSFTVLIGTMQGSLALLEKEKTEATVDEGQTEMEIAEDTEVKVDTEAQLEADKAFLAEAESSCAARKVEYDNRTSLRGIELAGINSALEILDKQREVLSNTFKDVKLSFLQLNSGLSSETTMAAQSAFSVLRAKAKQTHSLRLGLIAARLRKAMPEGAFTTVLSEIEKMMTKMKKETAADVKEKDSCTQEYFEIVKKTKKLTFLAQKAGTQMDKLEGRIDKFEEDKAATIKEIAEVDADLNQSLKLRTAENAAFKSSKADDELAIKTLTKTSDAMKKYYEDAEAKQAAALMQYDPDDLSTKRQKLKREENKYRLTDDLSQENAASAVLGMLDHITGNLEKEIADALEEEESAQLDYEKAAELMLESKAKLVKKKTSLEGFIADEKEDRSAEDDSKTSTEKDIADQAAYKASIKERCDEILSNFDDRASDRESEMDGLVRAKALLSGASLLQKDVQLHSPAEQDQDDDKSSLMGYLGMD